jgi:hypothetical protein
MPAFSMFLQFLRDRLKEQLDGLPDVPQGLFPSPSLRPAALQGGAVGDELAVLSALQNDLQRIQAQPYCVGLSWTDSAARKGLMTHTVP